jgi:hypothetical protein
MDGADVMAAPIPEAEPVTTQDRAFTRVLFAYPPGELTGAVASCQAVREIVGRASTSVRL